MTIVKRLLLGDELRGVVRVDPPSFSPRLGDSPHLVSAFPAPGLNRADLCHPVLLWDADGTISDAEQEGGPGPDCVQDRCEEEAEEEQGCVELKLYC